MLLQCVFYPRKTRLKSKRISVSQTLAQTVIPPSPDPLTDSRITTSVDSSYPELLRQNEGQKITHWAPNPFPNSSPTKPQAPSATACSLHFDGETVALQLFWLKEQF